ncbi:MAG: patatin-like phospholipase family protein [Planctomycetota bacterium]
MPRRRHVLGLLLALAAGCGLPERRAALPERPDELPPLAGLTGIRAVDGYPDAHLQASFDRSFQAFAHRSLPADGLRRLDSLVLTAGGPNGAFGAGVLTAWTERGDRPDFWFVTGVSVGALLAPFAFVGSTYDGRLEELFGSIEPEDLHRPRATLPSALWGESLMDSGPLRRLIAKGFDRDLMRAVAARHAEGARLGIGTTNLDTGRFVIWDLGEIATLDTDEALDLCRDVLAASAAIPVLYPPVRFTHEGRDELHVDGSVIRPFFIPQNVVNDYASVQRAGLDLDEVESRIFVLYNRSLAPEPEAVARETLAIATRTVTVMMQTMVAEHTLHLNLLAQAWNAGFHYISIPQGRELATESFGADETERLFELGRETLLKSGWLQELPDHIQRAELRRIAPMHRRDPDASDG